MRLRESVETPIDETEQGGRQQSGFAAPDRERAANDPLQVIVGSAAMVIAWVKLF